MRVQFLHLSGPLRGRTETYPDPVVLIGTDPAAAARFPAHSGVAKRHAEIRFDEAGCAFHARAIGGELFVNHQETREVILDHGDLLEFGVGGPKVRFRVEITKGSVCKPVRTMLEDAREVGRVSGASGFTGSFVRDLLTHATWQLKVGFPIAVLAVVAMAGFVGGWFGVSAREGGIEETLAAVRDDLARMARTEPVSRSELEAMRDEFDERSAAVERLVVSDEVVKRIHDHYSRGVCLLHGIYALRRPPRDGTPGEYLLDPAGDRIEIEYTGSGFLTDRDGRVVTNRHVARPWEFEAHLEGLLRAGFVPEFLHMTASFPGKAPVAVDPATARVRDDGFDVAVLTVPVDAEVPDLPMSTVDPFDLRGLPVVVVGYPTGVNALLAKADDEIGRAVTDEANDLTGIIAGLAARGAISPLITRGALNDVLAEKLVYDAVTTSGGSGGPVFGPDGTVIGVNFAVLSGFTGSNFGVPIRYVRDL